MAGPLDKILLAFTIKYGKMSHKLIMLLGQYLETGLTTETAVQKAMAEAAVATFLEKAVGTAIAKAASEGAGMEIPLQPALMSAWDPSGMTLSAKLHGAGTEMRQKIISTIAGQQKLNSHALQAARALYEGYNSGDRVTRKQALPQYMQHIVDFSRRSFLSAGEAAHLRRKVRQAQKRVDLLGRNGAPNKALKTSYKELLEAVDIGTSKALEKAVRVAVEEKSRYVAERIARTEAARAWADGFHARYDTDERVAAYKWALSSRHPLFDICNMYADANLWGLGPGVYPKDKTPILPVHPHCLCHLALVYRKEIDTSKQVERIPAGGDEWLKGLTHEKRCQVLGIPGAKEWEQGQSDWRRYMGNWSSETAVSRLKGGDLDGPW